MNKDESWLTQTIPEFMESNFHSRIASGMRAYWRRTDDRSGWPQMGKILEMENARTTLLCFRGFGSGALAALEGKLAELGYTLKSKPSTGTQKLKDDLRIQKLNLMIPRLKIRIERYENELRALSEPN